MGIPQLKRLRLERGLTQAQLAAEVHLSIQSIANYEQGRADPSIRVLKSLARVLNVSLTALVEGM